MIYKLLRKAVLCGENTSKCASLAPQSRPDMLTLKVHKHLLSNFISFDAVRGAFGDLVESICKLGRIAYIVWFPEF